MAEGWVKSLQKFLIEGGLTPDERRRLGSAPVKLSSAGYDPWGLEPETVKAAVAALKGVYRHYFRVETKGIENVPATGRCLVVANHGGQIALDGMLLSMALALEPPAPRFARGMMDHFVPSLPFFSTFVSRCGQVIGDPQNCRDLLNDDQCIMVFPEGTRGSGKTFDKRYQLQEFGTGFIRLALETRAPVIPVAIIGCEETYPGLANLKPLAKLFSTPYFPLTPFFPFLGPLGMIPIPAKVTLRFGAPMRFEGDPEAPDAEVEKMVETVRAVIRSELEIGLRKRGKRYFTGSAK